MSDFFAVGSQVKFVQDAFTFLGRSFDWFHVLYKSDGKEYNMPACFFKSNQCAVALEDIHFTDDVWTVCNSSVNFDNVFIASSPDTGGQWCLKQFLEPVEQKRDINNHAKIPFEFEEKQPLRVGQLVQLKQSEFSIVLMDDCSCIIQIPSNDHWDIDPKLVSMVLNYGTFLKLSNEKFEICCLQGNTALIKKQGQTKTFYVHVDLIDSAVKETEEGKIALQKKEQAASEQAIAKTVAHIGVGDMVKNAHGDFGTVESIRYYVKFDNGWHTYLESDQIFAATQKEKDDAKKQHLLKQVEEKQEQVMSAIKKLTSELDGLIKEKQAIMDGKNE